MDHWATQVLVVDDDTQFRRFVVRALRASGFSVIEASGFHSAISLIEEGVRADLMIADVQLGIGSPHGVSLGNMAQLRRSNLKIIYMSGSVDLRLAAQFGDAAAILQKPFVAAALIQTVTQVLGSDKRYSSP